MMNVSRPVGTPTPYQPYAAAPAPMAAPQPVMVNVAGQPQAQGTGILEAVKGLFTGIINFFKKLFGGGTATTVPGTVPGTTPGTTPVPGATADDATLAAQYGLRNDPANVAAFREILARTTAEAGVIGPGSTNRDAIIELQQVLTQFGHPVSVTGNFDPATAEALMAWKAKVGLTENFVFANGQPGTTPFVDARTKTKMIQILTGAPGTSTPATTTPPVVTPPVATPPAPPPPPPAPPPAPPAPPPAPPPPPPAPAPAPSPAPTPTTPATTPPTTSTPAAATGLTAEQTQIAKQAGILETVDNFAKFMTAAQAIEAATDVIGPGLRDTKETCTELQQVLKQFGYDVTINGTFDQATVAAVLKFKKDNNISYGYQMADGSAGVHPYIDKPTKDAMIKKLGGQ
jgi:hypothetical protein